MNNLIFIFSSKSDEVNSAELIEKWQIILRKGRKFRTLHLLAELDFIVKGYIRI